MATSPTRSPTSPLNRSLFSQDTSSPHFANLSPQHSPTSHLDFSTLTRIPMRCHQAAGQEYLYHIDVSRIISFSGLWYTLKEAPKNTRVGVLNLVGANMNPFDPKKNAAVTISTRTLSVDLKVTGYLEGYTLVAALKKWIRIANDYHYSSSSMFILRIRIFPTEHDFDSMRINDEVTPGDHIELQRHQNQVVVVCNAEVGALQKLDVKVTHAHMGLLSPKARITVAQLLGTHQGAQNRLELSLEDAGGVDRGAIHLWWEPIVMRFMELDLRSKHLYRKGFVRCDPFYFVRKHHPDVDFKHVVYGSEAVRDVSDVKWMPLVVEIDPLFVCDSTPPAASTATTTTSPTSPTDRSNFVFHVLPKAKQSFILPAKAVTSPTATKEVNPGTVPPTIGETTVPKVNVSGNIFHNDATHLPHVKLHEVLFFEMWDARCNDRIKQGAKQPIIKPKQYGYCELPLQDVLRPNENGKHTFPIHRLTGYDDDSRPRTHTCPKFPTFPHDMRINRLHVNLQATVNAAVMVRRRNVCSSMVVDACNVFSPLTWLDHLFDGWSFHQVVAMECTEKSQRDHVRGVLSDGTCVFGGILLGVSHALAQFSRSKGVTVLGFGGLQQTGDYQVFSIFHPEASTTSSPFILDHTEAGIQKYTEFKSTLSTVVSNVFPAYLVPVLHAAVAEVEKPKEFVVCTVLISQTVADPETSLNVLNEIQRTNIPLLFILVFVDGIAPAYFSQASNMISVDFPTKTLEDTTNSFGRLQAALSLIPRKFMDYIRMSGNGCKKPPIDTRTAIPMKIHQVVGNNGQQEIQHKSPSKQKKGAVPVDLDATQQTIPPECETKAQRAERIRKQFQDATEMFTRVFSNTAPQSPSSSDGGDIPNGGGGTPPETSPKNQQSIPGGGLEFLFPMVRETSPTPGTPPEYVKAVAASGDEVLADVSHARPKPVVRSGSLSEVTVTLVDLFMDQDAMRKRQQQERAQAQLDAKAKRKADASAIEDHFVRLRAKEAKEAQERLKAASGPPPPVPSTSFRKVNTGGEGTTSERRVSLKGEGDGIRRTGSQFTPAPPTAPNSQQAYGKRANKSNLFRSDTPSDADSSSSASTTRSIRSSHAPIRNAHLQSDSQRPSVSRRRSSATVIRRASFTGATALQRDNVSADLGAGPPEAVIFEPVTDFDPMLHPQNPPQYDGGSYTQSVSPNQRRTPLYQPPPEYTPVIPPPKKLSPKRQFAQYCGHHAGHFGPLVRSLNTQRIVSYKVRFEDMIPPMAPDKQAAYQALLKKGCVYKAGPEIDFEAIRLMEERAALLREAHLAGLQSEVMMESEVKEAVTLAPTSSGTTNRRRRSTLRNPTASSRKKSVTSM
eukprot:PhF_6_TR931/c0_g1_i1/m.1631